MIKTLYPIFQHWSDGGAVWFISDTHFDDADCRLMDPDWLTPKEHLKRINHLVKKNDTVVHLGDVGNPKYIHWMDGKRKILILGNHDAGASNFKDYFDEIYSGPLIIAEKIILSHEPIDVPWALNIHGHNHGNSAQDERHLNCASNVAGYLPINLKEVILSGALKRIDSIHRLAINEAKENPVHEKQPGSTDL